MASLWWDQRVFFSFALSLNIMEKTGNIDIIDNLMEFILKEIPYKVFKLEELGVDIGWLSAKDWKQLKKQKLNQIVELAAHFGKE